MRAALLALLLASCDDRPFEGNRYHGLPAGSTPTCSWDYIHEDRGQCIAGDRRFRCIRNRGGDERSKWIDVSCTPHRLWR